MSSLQNARGRKRLKLCDFTVKNFEWTRLRNSLRIDENTIRSETFFCGSNEHSWYLRLERASEMFSFVRLCLAGHTYFETSTEFSLVVKRGDCQVMKRNCQFVFTGKNRRSESYCVPIAFDRLDNETKICVALHAQFHSRLHNLGDTSHEMLSSDQEGLLSFLKNGNFHDVIIKVGGEEIKCHRFVLCWRSSYFSAMFRSGLSESKENVIEITDFNYGTIKNLISFLYTFECPAELTVASAMDLMKAADKYQISDLEYFCEGYLMNKIDQSNVLDILLQAEVYSAHKVKKHAMLYICKNFSAFKKAEQFEPLMTRPELLRDLLLEMIHFLFD